MKRFFSTTLIALCAALLLANCDALLGSDERIKTGILVISFEAEARAALSPDTLKSLSYKLTLTGPGDQTIEAGLSPGETFSQQIALGEWHIEAEAYSPGGDLFGAGSATVTVQAGMNQARIPMGVVSSTPAQYQEMILATPTATDPVTIEGSNAFAYTYNVSGPKGVFIKNRKVTLSPFKIAKYETTYELWYKVKQWGLNAARGANKYTFPYDGTEGCEGKDGNRGAAPTAAKLEPVTGVTWRDAIVWCNAYSEMSGKEPVYYTDTTYSTVLRVSLHDPTTLATAADKAVMKPGADGYRLPTEAEWEYAARGGKMPSATVPFTYWWAGTSTPSELKNYAWYTGNSGNNTHPVGGKQPNTLGLHDMSGNVYEWCWDWYDSSVGTGTVADPAGAARPPASSRIYRGGCYFSSGDSLCAVATRHEQYPYNGGTHIGFRVVCRP